MDSRGSYYGHTYADVQVAGNARMHIGDVYDNDLYPYLSPPDGRRYGSTNVSGGHVILGDVFYKDEERPEVKGMQKRLKLLLSE